MTLKSIFPAAEAMGGVLSAFFGIVIITGFLQCLNEVLRRNNDLFIRSFLLFLVIYTVSGILIISRGEPVDVMLRHRALLTFAWWIPCGIYAVSVHNKEILYEVWVKASYLISICCILIYYFHVPNNDIGANEYNMAFGFQLILPLLFQINELYRKSRWWLWLLVLYEIFLLIVYGNRGVLLSLIFYVVYKFAFESNSRIRKIISLFILGIASFLLLANIETIAVTAVNVLDMFNFESRTLDLLATGAIDDTSGRDELWIISYEMIEKHPLTGWGLGGESYYLAQRWMGTTKLDDIFSYTPHNGIVQNFVNFGILGGIVASWIVIYPLFHLKKHKDVSTHNLILIFLSAYVIPAYVSASGFFITPAVAICLYLFYCSNKENSKDKQIKKGIIGIRI